MFPGIPALVQKTFNAPQQAVQQEGPFQILLRIHTEWAKAKKSSPDTVVDFSSIKHAVLSTNPPCRESVTCMYKVVLKLSGGVDAQYLKEDEIRAKSATSAKRVVAPEFWTAMALDVKNDECVFVKRALLRAIFTVGFDIVNDENKLVTAAEAKKVHSRDMNSKVVEPSAISDMC
jgi:hypothetical protein